MKIKQSKNEERAAIEVLRQTGEIVGNRKIAKCFNFNILNTFTALSPKIITKHIHTLTLHSHGAIMCATN